jgi:hypothetical protein
VGQQPDEIPDDSEISNDKLWYDIPTFTDLEGVYYLMAARTVEGERGGRFRSSSFPTRSTSSACAERTA